MQATTYIAFLRAINVGGHVVKMDRLRALFSELGLENVRTYIQSGNVFFETTETDRSALIARIEQHLFQALGYEVATCLRTVPEVEHALCLDPFKDMEVTPDTRHYIVFTSAPIPGDQLPIISPKKDFEVLQATPGEAFVLLRLINGRPGNPAAYIEKTFKVKATARFFATTAKILQAANKV